MCFCSFFTGGVEAAVSVTVCSMSVIIPAILRALGVGDPFMREDTVDPNLSTGVEIARMTLTRVELGLPNPRNAVVPDCDQPKGAIDTVAPRRRRNSVGLSAKDDQKHRLTTQASDGSLGSSSMTKVGSLAEECDTTDLSAQVRSLPAVREDRDTEEGKNAKHNRT